MALEKASEIVETSTAVRPITTSNELEKRHKGEHGSPEPSIAGSGQRRAEKTTKTPHLTSWPKRLGRGIIHDIRARAPYYWSDWKDAWNYRVVPATALMAITCRNVINPAPHMEIIDARTFVAFWWEEVLWRNRGLIGVGV